MSSRAKFLTGLILLAVVLGLLNVKFWIIALVVVGIPVGAYLMLDPMQRQRLRRSGRKQIGS